MTQDWITLLKPLQQGGWELVDGKYQPAKTNVATDLPWIYAHVDFDCTLWNRVFHEVVANLTQVHSYCHDCIKVVAKPKTLRQLVRIEEIQSDMLFPGKCGIDRRENTQDIYGAFWYNRGFDEARMRYKLIRKQLDKAGMKSVKLIIKKACTEFENRLGPSNKWKRPNKVQMQLEEDMHERLRYNPTSPSMIPQIVKDRTHHLWVNWAFQHGDNTYLDFTDGVPIQEPLVTYNPEGEEGGKT
jgi:hypothetical protein